MPTKFCPVPMYQNALGWISSSANFMSVCSGSPATYADAYTNLMLARVPLNSGSFTIAADVSGYKNTVAQKLAVSITNSGSANNVVLGSDAGSFIVYFTTCTTQYLTAGGTVDFPAWKVNIQDPT